MDDLYLAKHLQHQIKAHTFYNISGIHLQGHKNFIMFLVSINRAMAFKK